MLGKWEVLVSIRYGNGGEEQAERVPGALGLLTWGQGEAGEVISQKQQAVFSHLGFRNTCDLGF